uniref:Uncharacterized protein n=1 Tax=Arundo donax TaxID=35708 RepID=A0A0A9BYN8_ARUDO
MFYGIVFLTDVPDLINTHLMGNSSSASSLHEFGFMCFHLWLCLEEPVILNLSN